MCVCVLLDSNVDDADVLVRFVCLWVDLDVGDPLHHLHPLRDASEHCVLVVQPWLGGNQINVLYSI